MIPNSVRWSALGIIGTALVVIYAFSVKGELNFSETMAFAQLLFTILAFGFVLYTLYVALAQLRKSMAKPKLRVSFDKEGAKVVPVINIRRDKSEDYNLYLWIINDGNAVTRLFQIDFEIPDIFDPKLKGSIGGRFLPYETIRPTSNGDASKDTRIISFYNDWDFCVFVNSPVEFLILSLKSLPQNYEEYEEEYEIRYRVYGDWAETQEGKLKVICKKK